MSYLVLAPIYWIPFDPPDLPKDPEPDPETMARLVLFRGLIRGPGLERMLGTELFDHVVEEGLLEPIP